jgi:hypothetical protein
LRRVLVLGAEDHAHGALDHLGGKLRELPHLGSILNRRSLLETRCGSRFGRHNLEDKTYGFIGRDDRRDLLTDRPGPFSRQDRLRAVDACDQAFFAGLGRSLNDQVDLRLGLRGGLKPFAQVRFRQTWPPSEVDLVDFRQTAVQRPGRNGRALRRPRPAGPLGAAGARAGPAGRRDRRPFLAACRSASRAARRLGARRRG